jgi:hypothetical protein
MTGSVICAMGVLLDGWEATDGDPSNGATERDFAGDWQALQKVAFPNRLVT